jgi:hypothetical protein
MSDLYRLPFPDLVTRVAEEVARALGLPELAPELRERLALGFAVSLGRPCLEVHWGVGPDFGTDYPTRQWVNVRFSDGEVGLRALAASLVEQLAPHFVPASRLPDYHAWVHGERHAEALALVDIPALLGVAGGEE